MGSDDHVSLQDLASRSRRGDEDASVTLVKVITPLILKIVRCRLPRRMDEKDLLQEILIKVFQRIDQYEGKVPFEHWVSKVAIHTCLDQLRYHRRRPELRWADLSEGEVQVLSGLLVHDSEPHLGHSQDARSILDHLLAGLSAEDEMVIRMLDLEEQSTKEISEATGWSVSLVKVRAFRARRKLRQMMVKLEKGLR